MMDQKNTPGNRMSQTLGTRLSNRREIAGTTAAIMAAIFLTVSLGGGGNIPGYKWRQALYVDVHMVKGQTSLTDFPVYVKLSGPQLKSVAYGGKVERENGYDIRFTDHDGATYLPLFIEKYHPQKGELTAWVVLDTLYSDKKTTFYMYYGNASEVTPAADMVESERLHGYFLDKEIQESGTSEVYSPEWLETEALNHSNPDEFVLLGEEEYMNKPIPVDFAYMKAELKGSNMVLVEWGTKGENDNESFFIEKSADGKKFESMDKMAGGRRTRAALGYSYSDAQPYSGKNYYRLRQHTNTGDFSYAPTLLVNYQTGASGLEVLSVEPLNFIDELRVKMHSDAQERVKIQFYTENGNLLWEGETQNKPGENSFLVPDLATYPQGRYVLGISGENRKLKTYLLTKEK